MGRKIAEAEEIRHASDYDDFYIATREEVEEQIDTAVELVEKIERIRLERRGIIRFCYHSWNIYGDFWRAKCIVGIGDTDIYKYRLIELWQNNILLSYTESDIVCISAEVSLFSFVL